MTGRRIGILGGTFNPVHRGHLLLALGAKQALRLDEVLWVPAHLPPHKELEGRATPADRARMVELALQGHPGFRLSRVELERPPPSYTVDTVQRLRAVWPARGVEWFFLLGSDNARELPTWRRIEPLRRWVRFVSIHRPGDPAARELPSWVVRLTVLTANVSSTEVRRRVRLGWEIHPCVPAAVARYIEEKGLYR